MNDDEYIHDEDDTNWIADFAAALLGASIVGLILFIAFFLAGYAASTLNLI